MHTNNHCIGTLLRLRIVKLIIYFNVLHKSLEYYNWDVFKIFLLIKSFNLNPAFIAQGAKFITLLFILLFGFLNTESMF